MKKNEESTEKKPDHIECQPGYIPAELKDHDQWVLWAYEKRNGMWTKVPYSPKSLRACDITNKQVLTDFTTAKKKLEKHNGRFAGLGFAVFADDPFVFVDLDHCRNPDTSELTLKARTILEKLDTYTEVSPSGTGIRAILKGELPAGARKQGDVELYDCKKYLTLTGATLPQYPATIESRPEEIIKAHAEYLPSGTRPSLKPDKNKPIGTTSYDEVLNNALDVALTEPKFKKLWDGDSTGYQSASEADLALVGYLVQYLGADPALMDHAFRKSALYRKKWDAKRGSTTYGAMTIDKALEGAKTVTKKGSSQKPIYPCTEITADKLLQKEFKDPRWAVKDLIPEGSTIICGKPKSGKSIAALNLAVGITSGNNRVFGNIEVESGGVLYLALEDTERRLKERLEKMLADGGIGSKELHLVTEWPHMGVGGLEKLEEKIKSISNLRLVIIDTLGRFKPPRPGNTNVYDFDYSVTSQITAVAHRHNVSIVIIHHLRKLESDDRFDDVSSSYGITGGVDTVVVLLSGSKKGGIKADSLMMIRGRDVEEETYAMKFDPQYLSWNIKGREDEIMTTDNSQKVFNAIANAGKSLGPKQISQISGIDYDYTRRLVQLMVKSGALIKEGRGKYKIKTLFDR
jgi:hypothetical protein